MNSDVIYRMIADLWRDPTTEDIDLLVTDYGLQIVHIHSPEEVKYTRFVPCSRSTAQEILEQLERVKNLLQRTLHN